MADDFFDLPPTREDAAKPGSRDYAIIEWANDRLEQGRRFVEASVGYDRISSTIDAIFANESDTGVSYAPVARPLSKTRVNLVAKTNEDLTALLTDTRVFFNYATHNPRYEPQARILNQQAEDWYTGRMIDLRIADVIRYCNVAGTGWAHLYYNRRLNDMMVDAKDPRMVYPIEPISYHTIQDALGVIIRDARTPGWVRAEYGKNVKADIGDPGIFGWLRRTFAGGSQKVSGPLSRREPNKDDAIPAVPTVFVNTMYLNDDRVNETNETIYMGKWNEDRTKELTSWSYKVPPGFPLYPFKRLTVWTTDTLLYDGPSPYWHGKFPLIKLTVNPAFPKSWLGKANLWDVIPLNKSMNDLLRVIDDHAAQVAQPSVIADRNVSKSELNKFNSRVPGAVIRTNMAAGKGIQVNPPPPLDQSLWQHVQWIEQMIQKLSGTADMSQISQLAQIPSDDTIDTLMKAMTPGNRSRSRIIEGFMLEFAEMYMYDCAEFDTLPKRIAKFGPGAVTPEDMDFDPKTFIPDDVPDGQPGDIGSMENALGTDEPRPRYVRAREMLKSVTYKFKKGSLLNSAATQERMEDLLLSKMGYISWFTLMENLGRMNLVPSQVIVPNSELERLQLQQQLGLGMVADAQGRKATNEAPPSMGQSGNGPTIQTS